MDVATSMPSAGSGAWAVFAAVSATLISAFDKAWPVGKSLVIESTIRLKWSCTALTLPISPAASADQDSFAVEIRLRACTNSTGSN